jgi:hypothetical protein
MSKLAPLLERLLPESADRFLAENFGSTMPRTGEGFRWGISSCGSFSGRIAADLLMFAKNHEKDAALVLADEDVVRILYFEKGLVVGSQSTVLFEHLGRVLLRMGALDEQDATQIVDVEQQAGLLAAASLLPEETLKLGLEQRTWEIGTNLPFMHNAHFVFVEGTPQLGPLPRLAIAPMDLAIEGLRRYDEWRNGPQPAAPSAAQDVIAEPPTDTPALRDAMPEPEHASGAVRATR